MDTSLSKALIMVAGLLLAIIVVSFLMYSLNQMSAWTDTQREEVAAEQIQKFNKEYEAYEKDLMYGVDVISCLNKSKSNNMKVDNGTYDSSYLITVEVYFATALEEKVTVYKYSDTAKREVTDNSFSSTSVTFKSIFGDIKTEVTTGLNYDGYLKTTSATVSMTVPKTYCLKSIDGSGGEMSDQLLLDLLQYSNEMKISKSNPNKNTDSSWTRAEWETPLYDMKKRKFKCTGLEYNSAGRISKISFREI